MIDPLIHFLALMALLVASGFMPHQYRPFIATGAGLFFLLVFAPTAAIFILICVLEAWLICLLVDRRKRSDSWRKYLPYILLLNLFFVDFHALLLGHYVQTVGISFSVIRIFMTAKQLVSSRTNMRNEYARWLAVSAFYLPAIIVGPVFSGLDIRKQALLGNQMPVRISRTYRHLVTGLVLAVLVSPFFGEIIAFGFMHMVSAFLMLFAAFWGQSLIAENSSRLLGYRLPQNFHKPWLASDIRDFWRRWHVSMAQFIMQYVYLPLTLRGISPRHATIAAFLFMGLWHEVAIGYLVWGLGHGLLMAYWPQAKPGRSVWFKRGERAVTLLAVICLSFIANHTFR